jgi:Lon protease-like protein
MPQELTLLPIPSVLYSGGVFTLRIIEPRYHSMVSDCFRNKKPFIVASSVKYSKNQTFASFNEIGTLAHIIDFDSDKATLLKIICRGSEKVRIIQYQTKKNGLILAEIEKLPSVTQHKLPKKYHILSTILKNYMMRDGAENYAKYLEEEWDNLDWLSCRLSEILPIDRQQHYELFIMEPLERLRHIKQFLKNINWL